MGIPGSLTAAYAAILALIFVGLSVRTLLRRRRVGVGVGDGGDAALQKAARAHANFAEYTPLSLFLIYLLEVVSGSILMVHVYGVVLLAGRTLHAYGVSQVEENYRFRVAGMACTFVVLVGTSLGLLWSVTPQFV